MTAPAIAHLCAKFILLPHDEQDAIKQELTDYIETRTCGGFELSQKRHPRSSALIKESLRLCPPAPFFREKRTRDVEYPNYGIPGGTSIG